MNSKTKGIVLTLALSIAVCGFTNVAFAGIETDPNLNKLEMKFFQHDYAKDDADTRLDRLEKLVFGEAKTGDDTARLANLIAAVGPNLDDVASSSSAAPADGAAGGNNAPATAKANDADTDAVQREQQISDGSQYPAVTAMERKVFKGKDYASEPIVKRVERLEVAQFGKASDSTDLSDRVDRLKAQTGVDLARTPPPGSDWSDDEEQQPGGGSSITYHPPAGATPRSSYSPDEDPMFNNTHSAPRSSYAPAYSGGGGVTGGSGTYGGGGMSSSSAGTASGFPTGSYGYNPPAASSPRRIASLPPSTMAPSLPSHAPNMVSGGDDGAGAMPPAAPATGLVPQISALEKSVFGRVYTNESLSVRLSRLEGTVFPGTRPNSEASITDRVNKLVAMIQPGTGAVASPRVAQNPNGMPPMAPDYTSVPGMPPVAPARSGISKIINGLGSLLGGGGMGMGAYPMSSNLVQDPSTGYLIDTMTGNMINPTTGQVVRQGMGSVTGGYSSGFNSGLSPIGSPYGYGSGMRSSNMNFGFGGSGIRFGGGGMGMGMGMGGMGRGIGGYPIGTMTGW